MLLVTPADDGDAPRTTQRTHLPHGVHAKDQLNGGLILAVQTRRCLRGLFGGVGVPPFCRLFEPKNDEETLWRSINKT